MRVTITGQYLLVVDCFVFRIRIHNRLLLLVLPSPLSCPQGRRKLVVRRGIVIVFCSGLGLGLFVFSVVRVSVCQATRRRRREYSRNRSM